VILDLTVAICTFNGEQRLPAVLDRLLAQTPTPGVMWEVLVVDNNSQDETAKVVADYAARWRDDSRLRYVFEPIQGLSYARNRAIAEAASQDLVAFLDDDYLLSDTWLTAAVQFGKDHPQAGAYGGRHYVKTADVLPADFHQIKFLLALEDRGADSFQYTARGSVPGGPCFVVRKQAWQDAVPLSRRLRGKENIRGIVVSSAEDLEIVIYIQSSRWQVWHNPKMEGFHHIAAGRFEPEHLTRLARSGGLSAHACRIAKLPPWQRPFMPLFLPFYLAISAGRVAVHYLQHYRTLKTNLAQACLFEYKLGVLLSPWFTPQPMLLNNDSVDS
jgi:glycosyltransferase involved in cell wall biosynthesis